MIQDPVSNLCTVIRNGYMRGKKSVSVPYSKAVHALASVLVGAVILRIEKSKETFSLQGHKKAHSVSWTKKAICWRVV